MKRILFLSALIYLSFMLSAQDNANTFNPDAPNVEIKGTQIQYLYSKIMDQEYELQINLPRGYAESNEKFPVFFLLDSQWDFPLVQALYGQQYYDGFVPGVVTVGITWAGKDANADVLRARDFTPTSVNGSGETGKASEFLEFFRNELIPYVEKYYKVNSDRALAGSSLGGLFTLYAMFTQTDLFSKYFLTSPAVQWDNQVLFQTEKKYAETHSDLNVRLFMAIGGYEYQSLFEKMIEKIDSRNYKSLKFEHKVIEGVGHSGGKAEGYTRGLQFIYEHPQVNVAPEILEKYVGDYEVGRGAYVRIMIDKSNLLALLPNGEKVKLNAISDTEFYVKGSYSLINFDVDKDGNTTGAVLENYNGKMKAEKI